MILTQAIDDLKTWEDDVINKTDAIQIGHSRISVPKRSDPYLRLHAQTVPYIIEVRKECRDLEAWLEANDDGSESA